MYIRHAAELNALHFRNVQFAMFVLCVCDFHPNDPPPVNNLGMDDVRRWVGVSVCVKRSLKTIIDRGTARECGSKTRLAKNICSEIRLAHQKCVRSGADF